MSQDENTNATDVYTLSDKAISQIARLLQIAILTGTDVVDNLRTLKIVVSGTTLEPDPEYMSAFEDNLTTMLVEAQRLAEEAEALEKNADALDEIDNEDW